MSEKFNWFIRKGVFFIPVSIPGMAIAAISLIFIIYFYVDISSHSHSVSDTLINFVFNLIFISVCYSLIAFFTEKR